MINQYYRKIIKHIIIGLILLISLVSISGAETEVFAKSNEIRAALIYRFLDFVRWKNDKKMSTIVIGYWGHSNDQFAILKSIRHLKTRKKTLQVIRLEQISQLDSIDAIFLDNDSLSKLTKIAAALPKNVLLITNNSESKRYLMLNIIDKVDKTVGFEVNRYNAVYAGIKIKSEILVLGGTELDIAELLKEMESSLESSRNELQKNAETLSALEEKSQIQNKAINQKNSEIEIKDLSLKNKEAKLDQYQTQILISNCCWIKY